MSCSVHWRPLHLHPYYEQTFGWRPADLPVASAVWTRLVSLPTFSAMRADEIDAVVHAVRDVCAQRVQGATGSLGMTNRVSECHAVRERRDTGPQ